ncbi:MAG: anti-sigma factor family protein [Clostridia bacterium]
MSPEEARKLLHAYVDGELDPAAVLELEGTIARDPALRAALERLRAVSAAIREKADYHAAPPGLAGEVLRGLPGAAPAASRRAPAWTWLAPAAAFAAAALVAWTLWLAPGGIGEDDRLARDLLTSHARATLSGRIQVASSDLHTVKPWLSARLPFSPPVPDLAAQGFPLAGGRLDYVDGRPVAVLVFERRKHIVEAYVWPGNARAWRTARDGFNVEAFSRDGMTWCLVSDIGQAELQELGRLLQSVTPASG